MISHIGTLSLSVRVQNDSSDALEEVSWQSTARPQVYAYHVTFDRSTEETLAYAAVCER
jgi:hypothetical protein